jgi:m7GpppX diphosphatase
MPAVSSHSPDAILRSTQKAFILGASDNHVNLLLLSADAGGATDGTPNKSTSIISKDSSDRRSLLKLTVVSPHKGDLVVSKRFTSVEDLTKAAGNDTKGNDDDLECIRRFLANFNFTLTSESGAEYSYYSIRPKNWWERYWPLAASIGTMNNTYTMELISPASDRQIERSLAAPDVRMVQETAELYQAVVRPHIQSIVDSGSLAWVQNVVNGTKEKERLLLDHADFVLNIDTKWRSHPDPSSTPRAQWHGHSSIDDLYCLAIVKDATITCLRDLRRRHIDMLTAMYRLGVETIATTYGVTADQLRIYCHYQPQFYQFHLHFTRLHNELGCQVERGHLVTDLIQNLQLADDYYAKRAIAYKLNTSCELYGLITAAASSSP